MCLGSIQNMQSLRNCHVCFPPVYFAKAKIANFYRKSYLSLQNKSSRAEALELKRKDRDSNPGYPQGHNGFRDRPDRPLRHLSIYGWASLKPTAKLAIFFVIATNCRNFNFSAMRRCSYQFLYIQRCVEAFVYCFGDVCGAQRQGRVKVYQLQW